MGGTEDYFETQELGLLVADNDNTCIVHALRMCDA